MAGFCIYGIGPSGFIQGEKFLDFASWSCFVNKLVKEVMKIDTCRTTAGAASRGLWELRSVTYVGHLAEVMADVAALPG